MNSQPLDSENKGQVLQKLIFGALVLVLLTQLYIITTPSISRDKDSTYQGLQTKTAPVTTSPGKPVATAHTVPSGKRVEVPVSFDIGGRIDKVYFADHAKVKQGDVLATIDKAPFEQALANAKLRLMLALQQYDAFHASSPNPNFYAIEAARRNVDKTQYAYDNAHAEFTTYARRLNFAQPDNVYLDNAQNERDALLALERAWREFHHQEAIGRQMMGEQGYRSAVVIAQNSVSNAERDLDNTRLIATSNGIITSSNIEPGRNIAPGTKAFTFSVIEP